MKNVTGSVTTYLAGTILLSFGFVYLFRNSFMPYHSAAIRLAWTQVDPDTQYLFLALMKATAGGFISLSFAIIFLQYKFTIHKISWIPLLILLIGTISMVCTSWATIIISSHTPGRLPVEDAVIGELLLIVGFIFNRKYLRKDVFPSVMR